MFRHLAYAVLGRAGYLVTLALPAFVRLDCRADAGDADDHAIREEGEQVRKAFPEIDFDDPVPRREMRR